MTPDKYAQLRQLYELERLRRTVPEMARAMDLSEYAVRQLKKDPDYAEVRKDLRADLREAALTQVHELGSEAIEVLRQLMYDTKVSAFVRFNAAAKLGDWMGLSTMVQPEEADDRSDVSVFLKQFLDKRAVTITSTPLVDDTPIDTSLHLPIVQHGGLLPDLSLPDE